MKDNYYDQNLNAQKLYQVYHSKYCGVSQYLEAEISFVKNHLQGTEQILELGAGYGRIMKELAPLCRSIVGIDISRENVEFGRGVSEKRWRMHNCSSWMHITFSLRHLLM